MSVRDPVHRDPTSVQVRNVLLLVCLSYTLGFAAYWHFLFIFNPRFATFYAYQRDLLAGHTEWVADQNRVLAPLLIKALQAPFNMAYENAYQHFMFGIFIAENLCVVLLFWCCGLTLGQSVLGLLLATTVPVFLMNLWWFPWTNLEYALVLLCFVVDAARVRPSTRAVLYGCVFVAWMLTKETCFLLPVWIGLRYGLPALQQRRWQTLAQLAALCVGMVILSSAVVSGLRHWLWVSGSNPAYPSGMPTDLPTVLAGTHLYSLSPDNLHYMLRNYRAFFSLRSPWPLWGNSHFRDWSVGMIEELGALAIAAGCAVWAFSRRDLRVLALSLLALFYLLVLFAITNTVEADKLLPLVAVGAYGYAVMAGRTSVERPVAVISGGESEVRPRGGRGHVVA